MISDLIGPMFYPLVVLSLLAVMFIVERGYFFFCLPASVSCSMLEQCVDELKANKKLDKPTRDDLVSFRLEQVREKLYFGIRFLRVIAVLSPMLGLLGTVVGMIEAFGAIVELAGPVTPSVIAEGMMHALYSTVFGLSIALPSLLAAFMFSRIAEKRILTYSDRLNLVSFELAGAKLNKAKS